MLTKSRKGDLSILLDIPVYSLCIVATSVYSLDTSVYSLHIPAYLSILSVYLCIQAQVYSEDGVHWDSMLNQTNLKNNNNKFYLLQLLKDNTSGHYSTWFRWGRGDETRTHTRTRTHACTHTHTHCVTNCTSVVSVTDLNQASSVLYAWVAMHGYASFLSVIPLHIGIPIISYIPLCLHTLLGFFLA